MESSLLLPGTLQVMGTHYLKRQLHHSHNTALTHPEGSIYPVSVSVSSLRKQIIKTWFPALKEFTAPSHGQTNTIQ